MDSMDTRETAEAGRTKQTAINVPLSNPSKTGSTPPLPEHLVRLSAPDWGLWRWAALRGAGFPLVQLLQLAVPTLATATQRFLDLEVEAEPTRERLRQLLQQAHPGEVEGKPWKLRRQKARALRLIDEWQSPEELPPLFLDEAQAHLETFRVFCAKRERLWSELRTQFELATIQTMQALQEVARDERFREAVTWQDRAVVHSGIDPFLYEPINTFPTAKQREYSLLIAKYLQRYCAKNDSIGFFGPVGWARLSSDGAVMDVRPGPALVATRTVYFETWGIEALGEALIARDRTLLAWAAPRRMPFLYLEGTLLHVPFAGTIQLSATHAAALAACDGQKTARDIAQELLARPELSLASEAEVFAMLEHLRTTRRIAWAFEISLEEWYPERALRRQFERIVSEPERRIALDTLDRLEQARSAVAMASGNVEQLDLALKDLETTFSDLTGREASRLAGETYAARTLVYEDCRRDLDLILGPALLTELGQPLELLLTSARWLTYTAAQRYKEAFQEVYRELVRKIGSSTIDFTTFWSWVQPLFTGEPAQNLVQTLQSALQERWAAVLNLPAGQSHVHYTSEQLRPLAQKVFATRGPGWPAACYHSPDVLIAAKSVEAIQQGDYQFVLGEFHLGLNTLGVNALAVQHPTVSELFQAIAADLPDPRVVPIISGKALYIKRGQDVLTLAKDWRLLCGVDPCNASPDRILCTSALLVEEVAGELMVRTRDGEREFNLLQVFDILLSLQVYDSFKLLHSGSHTPRVSIDRLVICRETWRFDAAEIAFAFCKDALERHVEAQRWVRAQKLPRFLFIRSPLEQKPYYLDMGSPIFVELAAKIIRQAHRADSTNGSITLTEMLPDPEHAWLPDADGNRYTSELRVVAVDQLSC